VLVLAGEALGASSVMLYGLCIVRRALPPSAQPPGEPAQPPCHVQARARPCVPFHAGILCGILSTVAGAGTLAWYGVSSPAGAWHGPVPLLL